jgi:hypothetical protein
MGDGLFVPEDFVVPDGLITRDFRLTPLGPQHNEADYAAWTSSIDHIRATPGFREGNWPREGERRLRASVESWVRADHAALDPAVHDAVVAWLERDWPFDSVEYAARTG